MPPPLQQAAKSSGPTPLLAACAESLPGGISGLTSLRALSVCGNRLTALPEELGACSRLEEADFSQNQIPHISEALSSLQSLRLLNLDANK